MKLKLGVSPNSCKEITCMTVDGSFLRQGHQIYILCYEKDVY